MERFEVNILGCGSAVPTARHMTTAQFCCTPFQLIMHPLDTTKQAVLYEDKEMMVETIPLNHRVPCCGFLFSEKPKLPVLLPEKCKAYGIPPRELGKIKAGADWTMEDGRVIPNSELTVASDFVPRKYAYCSDTAYYPKIIPQIQDVDLLYHEATFISEDEQQAVNAAHSTAAQAATIARDAHVGQLAIGHYSIRYDDETALLAEAKRIFPNTVASQEGMTIRL